MYTLPSSSASADETDKSLNARPRIEIGHLSAEQVAELVTNRIDFSNAPDYDDVHIRHAVSWALVFLQNDRVMLCLTRRQCAAIRARLQSEAAR